MRILLAQNSLYYPAHGGGDKSNRLLLEALAARGHDCRAVTRVHTEFGEAQHRRYLDELAVRQVRGISVADGVVRFPHNGVDVRAVTTHPNFRAYFATEIAAFTPDVTIVSTDDPAQLLLGIATGDNPARVVYLARTTLALPFGPEGAFPSEEKTELLRRAESLVGVSEYVAAYIRRWSGIDAIALPISLLEPGPWPELGSFDSPYITLVNPCAVKGIAIFLALAEAFPGLRFAAVPTWGTTEQDREALAAHPNIDVLDPVDNIDDLLRRTRVMLVPSLWAEARSRIIVEAMLRGVPVLAADVGGIPEAMMGADYLLPVRQIESYQTRVDDQMVPVANVPRQDVGPWRDALAAATGSRERYEALSRTARDKAVRYAEELSVGPLEEHLTRLVAGLRNPLRDQTAARAPTGGSPAGTLSPAKRALLALRLKKRTPESAVPQGDLWFPNISQSGDARLRLFCFPYAGGGVSVFRTWQSRMPAGVAVVPVRLPGRESRAAETPIDRIDVMADAVSAAIEPHLDRPYALFGHSLGAMICFELTRRLRDEGRPLPLALLVAGARAPQFRRDPMPGPVPGDDEFLREIRSLEGVPPEVLDNEELLRYLLPALKADSLLGRRYVYQDDDPLPVPIRAYMGADDPRLPADVIAAWRQQTTVSFAIHQFPGGHFFIHTDEGHFLEVLRTDLSGLVS